MTWTTPRTWADGDYPGGTVLNQHLKDNLLALYSPPMVEAHRTSTLTVAAGATQLVTMDDERYDQDWGPGSTGTFHSLVSNTSRIVIPYDGIYEITAFWQWSSIPGSGNSTMNLRLNAAGSSAGGTSLRSVITGADRVGFYTMRYPFTAGQYFELFATNGSGGSLNLALGPSVTGVAAKFLGA